MNRLTGISFTALRPIAVAIAAGAFFSNVAQADGWAGEAEAGAVATSGNTDNSSLTARVDVSRTSGAWIHNILADAYKAEVDGGDTADRFSVGYKPKRLINDRTYLFGLLIHDEDSFANIDSRQRAVGGVGHFFINSDTTLLLGEAGIGARKTELLSGGESSDEGIVYLYGKYKQRVLENADFIATLAVDSGSDNTFSEAAIGLQVGLGGNLALKASYGLRRNSDIVGSRGDKQDTITGITLVYGIK